jgi:hypothetical protein
MNPTVSFFKFIKKKISFVVFRVNHLNLAHSKKKNIEIANIEKGVEIIYDFLQIIIRNGNCSSNFINILRDNEFFKF